jgi:hypothetical protein
MFVSENAFWPRVGINISDMPSMRTAVSCDNDSGNPSFMTAVDGRLQDFLERSGREGFESFFQRKHVEQEDGHAGRKVLRNIGSNPDCPKWRREQ